jgi:hypothetical protein
MKFQKLEVKTYCSVIYSLFFQIWELTNLQFQHSTIKFFESVISGQGL